MKDFRNKEHYVVYCGVVTGKEFQDKYNDLSLTKDKLPVASTIIPINIIGEENQPIFHAWIFYEMQGEEKKEGQPEENKSIKKKKLDLGDD